MQETQPENTEHIYKKTNADSILRMVAMVLVVSSIFTTFILAYFYKKNINPSAEFSTHEVKKFANEQEFMDYLEKAEQSVNYIGIGGRGAAQDLAITSEAKLAQPTTEFSQTNVQVKGVDEPDIVKTDGKNIYYSGQPLFYRGIPTPLSVEDTAVESEIAPTKPSDLIMPERYTENTSIISAFPIDSLSNLGSIARQGELLINGNTLIILGGNSIYGFSVEDPQNPRELWSSELDQTYLEAARLYNDKLYLITRTSLYPGVGCAIPLMKSASQTVTISCIDIYHPTIPVSVDSTYTALEINPLSGEVDKKISFTGSSGQSVVYMSPESLFITYTYQADSAQMYYDFFLTDGSSLLPLEYLQKIQKLQNYDISSQSKMTEVQLILGRYQTTLGKDDALKFQQEMANKFSDYEKKHLRELVKSGIVRINIKDLSLKANGVIPGYPLNQFSLDEYNGNLRLATTLGGVFSGVESANDVYVLNDSLNIIGSIRDLGLGERVYSARFIEDKAYLVTYKQIDPFYVLDLGNPTNPKKLGELKIPGYSSYLHPLSRNRILGVGKEGSQVKLSLFDVANSTVPTEVSKYNLTDYWSEALNTHHAFLHDERNNVFFMPGTEGGYIFSYDSDQLTLKKAVSLTSPQRAVYIANYLYIIGQERIIVLDEQSWEVVKELSI